MRTVSMNILRGCITLAIAKELAALPNGIEQNLINRAKSTDRDANLDATTFGKPAAAGAATMNRLALPMKPMNRPFLGRVNAGLQEATLAARYAAGLFDTAQASNELESIKEGLDSLGVGLKEVPELKKVLDDPVGKEDAKRAILNKITDGGKMGQFCNYLVDKARIDLLPEIIESFGQLYNNKLDTKECKVVSACELTEDQLAEIAKSVQKQTGAKAVKIKQSVDESLIGGFILTYGSSQVDLSVKSSLEALPKILAGAQGASR